MDVGVNRKSHFLNYLANNPDLFVIGFEPSNEFAPCSKPRCVFFKAACTPETKWVKFHNKPWSVCSSMLNGNLVGNGRVNHEKCLKDRETDGTMRVVGLALSEITRRIPSTIEVQYVKVDAQGYDLEVMKGLLSQAENVTIVSLEAQDVHRASELLYLGQPTLSSMKMFLDQHKWQHLGSRTNNKAVREVDAFFAHEFRSSKLDTEKCDADTLRRYAQLKESMSVLSDLHDGLSKNVKVPSKIEC
mmetsp:Transcript_19988/g.29931  ORF Transcript_19988/g.29931 Transcript_19988/m.29931 type:complete len:245 (+) Transcript_19988:446-1180(+)